VTSPRSYNKVEGGHSTARVQHVEGDPHAERDSRAYWNVLGFAKDQPDPAGWAADILAALGLDRETRRAPTKLRDPFDTRARKIRADLLKAKAAHEADRRTRPKPVAHGTPQGYRDGCGCDECREAIAKYNRAYLKRRRAEARAEREAGS
jgi:hypothetical protein